MANAAGFQHFCGPFVTILSSKNSQRYRIQSDNLSALWLLIQSLENRLHSMFDHPSNKNGSGGPSNQNSPLEFSYSASLPLHEYFTEIETHFHKRNKLELLMVSRWCLISQKSLKCDLRQFHKKVWIWFLGTISPKNVTTTIHWKAITDSF